MPQLNLNVSQTFLASNKIRLDLVDGALQFSQLLTQFIYFFVFGRQVPCIIFGSRWEKGRTIQTGWNLLKVNTTDVVDIINSCMTTCWASFGSQKPLPKNTLDEAIESSWYSLKSEQLLQAEVMETVTAVFYQHRILICRVARREHIRTDGTTNWHCLNVFYWILDALIQIKSEIAIRAWNLIRMIIERFEHDKKFKI